jgi:hypothetical protein
MRLQMLFANFQEFSVYAFAEKLAKKHGFYSLEKFWRANPIIKQNA